MESPEDRLRCAEVFKHVQQCLTRLDLRFGVNHEPVNHCYFSLDWVKIVIDVGPRGDNIVVYSILAEKIPEDKRREVALLLAKLNFQMDLGTLQQDMSDGEVRFKVSTAWGSGRRPDLFQTIRTAISVGMGTFRSRAAPIFNAGGVPVPEYLLESEQDAAMPKIVALCRKGDVAGVRAAIEAGSAVDEETEQGATALMVAAMEGSLPLCELLLDCGADINHESKASDTALLLAIAARGTNVALLLLKRGANYNHVDSDGDTALTAAALMNLPEVVSELLGNRDIDLNHRNKDGKTALEVAESEGHTDIVRLLRPVPTGGSEGS